MVPAHGDVTQPLTYEDVKALAVVLGRPAETLIALAASNDPFYVVPRRQTAANWFAIEVWPLLDIDENGGIHVRRVHYVLVSLPAENRPRKPDGTAYENTSDDWDLLVAASRDARELDLVDAGLFIDRRAAEPVIYIPEGEDSDAAIDVVGGEISEQTESVPSFTYAPRRYVFPGLPDYSVTPPEIAEPYVIELWIEKSTMADVLEPIARRYGVTLVTGVGELSLTRVHEVVERVSEHRRKTRIIYISDFDPAGNAMPVSIARKIEFLLRRDGLGDLDIRLDPLLLTREQVEHYQLPRIPIKDSERRKVSFEERFGEGAVELDALEALHPGELARLVIDRIEVYRSPAEATREDIAHATYALERDAETIREEVLAEHTDTLAQLRTRFDEMQAAIRPHQDSLAAIATEFAERFSGPIAEHIAAINGQVATFYEQASEVWSDITTDLESNAPDPNTVEWPAPYDANEPEDPLFDSARSYVEQIDRYKKHQGKPTTRRRRNNGNGARHDRR
jgi:hypothetical protein